MPCEALPPACRAAEAPSRAEETPHARMQAKSKASKIKPALCIKTFYYKLKLLQNIPFHYLFKFNRSGATPKFQKVIFYCTLSFHNEILIQNAGLSGAQQMAPRKKIIWNGFKLSGEMAYLYFIKNFTVMKKGIFLVLLAFLWSCQNAGTEQKSGEKADVAKPAVFQVDSAKVFWTAYKYTKRVGVNGSFDRVEWKGLKAGKQLSEILNGASFKIDVQSLNTGNPQRDKTITEYLFGKMMETNFIEGRVLKTDDARGIITVVLRMNNTEKPVDFKFTQVDNHVTAIGKIDLVKDFHADEPLYFLHTACEDKHTGEDGVSKTWPDVDLKADLYLSPVEL